MTDKERKSCIRTIEFLRGLAFNVHGVMDIIDAQNCDEIIKMLEKSEPQIIRCKDCRWWDKSEDSPFGYCMAMKHGYMTANWEIGIYRRYKGDFYCADAERRNDERTD